MTTKILFALEIVLVGMLIYFSCVILPPMKCEVSFLKIKNQYLVSAIKNLQKENYKLKMKLNGI